MAGRYFTDRGECKMVGEKCAPGEAGKMQAPGRKGAPPNNHQIEIVIKWEHTFIPPWDGEKGGLHCTREREGGIAQEAVWLFTWCILILQDGGLDKWKPANAPRDICLPSSFCRVINPRIMSIALILKISVYSVNVPGLYPATGKNVPLHLALQPQNIILQNCPHTNSYSSTSNIFKYCNYEISGLHWRANWK